MIHMKEFINLIILNNEKKSKATIVHNVLNDIHLDLYYQLLNQYVYAKEEREMTIKQISEKSEVPEQTIIRFENLKSIPQTTTLIKILDAVGLELTVRKKEEMIEV